MSEIGNGLTRQEIQCFIDGRKRALREAAALIRAAEPMTLTILPAAHDGVVVVRDLREELATKVEGLAA